MKEEKTKLKTYNQQLLFTTEPPNYFINAEKNSTAQFPLEICHASKKTENFLISK